MRFPNLRNKRYWILGNDDFYVVVIYPVNSPFLQYSICHFLDYIEHNSYRLASPPCSICAIILFTSVSVARNLD